MSEQSKAVNLAIWFESYLEGGAAHEAAAELRRLDAENAALRAQLEGLELSVAWGHNPFQNAQLAQGEPVSKASIWQQGYNQGVKDEETSAANIGIAGLGGKVSPARVNPYTTPQQAPVDEREAFEAWWLKDTLCYDNPFESGSPKFWTYEGWQAALKPAVPSKLAGNANPLNFSNIEARVAYVMGWNGCVDSMLAAAKDGES